ncbi:MAG: M1 family aminopeptidase [Bryobacteraceae bacterium]
MRGVRWAIAFLAVIVSAFAQEKTARVKVQHYVITAEINPRTQSISATAKVDFVPLDNTDAAVFELNNALKISKVVDSQGQTLEAARNSQDLTVRVALPSPLAKNQASSLTFTYDGQLTGGQDSPVYGITFASLKPDFGFLLYPARWFPITGYTVDRFTAELHITAPSEYNVISSGDEKTETLSGGRTLYSFAYSQNPSFPGSLALVKGDGQKVSSQGVTTNVYFRQHTNLAQNYGEETGKIMGVFTNDFGLAPQANLSLVETVDGGPNGYAAPGIVFLAPGSITNQVNQRLLADQLARQWWGVLISSVNRNHLWITNGAARYAQVLYLEQTNGPGAIDSDIHNDYVEALTITDPPMLQAGRLEDYSPEFWALTAAKGAAVLNMLRGVIGDQAFFKGLKAFIDQYGWKSVSSADFEKSMEQASGQDLRSFFIQWLESSGAPEFKLSYTIFRTQKGFRVVGKVSQDMDTFRMPVDLRIETEGNPEDKKVDVAGTSSEFSVDTFGKPRSVTLDPNHRILRFDSTMRVAVAIRRGEQFVEVGDFSNALREYQKALDVNRNSSLAHYRIGELFFKQGNYQSAANEFRSAIDGDLQPKWVEVWSRVNLGNIFDVTGQRDRAVNEYKQALRTHDNTAGAQEKASQYLIKPYEKPNSEMSG